MLGYANKVLKVSWKAIVLWFLLVLITYMVDEARGITSLVATVLAFFSLILMLASAHAKLLTSMAMCILLELGCIVVIWWNFLVVAFIVVIGD